MTTDTTERRITGIPAGRAYHGHRGQGWISCRLANGRTHADGYEVDAAWPINERHDDDFGSVLCGCPMQGRAHRHVRATATTAAEAAARFDAWAADLAAKRPIRDFETAVA